MTAEEFVHQWFRHWGLLYPQERARQLVGDLRVLTGDSLQTYGENASEHRHHNPRNPPEPLLKG
jgi:hypothetical protein